MDISNPLVSIVLCTYNGEQFLKDQLASLMGQTYSNLEIIVVDDCSTDGTKELLISFAGLYDNIKLFLNEHNLGYNKNFEKAISFTKGEYISICDQDDIWFPEKIQRLMDAIGENWAVFSNSEFVDGQMKQMGRKLISNDILMDSYKSILMENFFTGHTSLLRRESLQYILPIPKFGFYDWWIGFVCLYHKKLIFHNEVLTYYRVHEESVTQSKTKRKYSIAEDLDMQLGIFLKYKGLEPVDRVEITGLRQKLRKQGIISPLFYELFLKFSIYFPKRNHQSLLSKLNFLRKFLKKER